MDLESISYFYGTIFFLLTLCAAACVSGYRRARAQLYSLRVFLSFYHELGFETESIRAMMRLFSRFHHIKPHGFFSSIESFTHTYTLFLKKVDAYKDLMKQRRVLINLFENAGAWIRRYPKTGDDRRQAVRIPNIKDLVIRSNQPDSVECLSLNESTGGIKFLCRKKYKVGTKLKVRHRGQKHFEIKAKVLDTFKYAGCYCIRAKYCF